MHSTLRCCHLFLSEKLWEFLITSWVDDRNPTVRVRLKTNKQTKRKTTQFIMEKKNK